MLTVVETVMDTDFIVSQRYSLASPRRRPLYQWLEMWANVHRDGRPAEYRWRRLFNAAVWLTPTSRVPCSNAANSETRWNLLGCPKLTKWSQPLVGRSSPCRHVGRYCCLTIFFRLSICGLVAKIYPDKVVRWCPDGDFWRLFCVLCFSEPRATGFRPAS